MHRLNTKLKFDVNFTLLPQGNAAMIADYDFVADVSDYFRTRYLLNDRFVQMKCTLVSAALLRFDGQLFVFMPHAGDRTGPHPKRLRDLPPDSGTVSTQRQETRCDIRADQCQFP
jgi:adenylyltransferase/sulfurtransferase